MNRDSSLREKIQTVYQIAKYRPLTTFAVLGISLVVAVLEGIGMGFILPIIEIAQNGGGQGGIGPAQYFVRAYSLLGIPFNLGYIILGVGMVIAIRYTLTFLVRWFTAELRMSYVEHLRRESFANARDA